MNRRRSPQPPWWPAALASALWLTAGCEGGRSESTVQVPSIQIGDLVWLDTDADGVQDPGEPGINGVRVLLKDDRGKVVSQTVTGNGPNQAGGWYRFEEVLAGNYLVEVDESTLPGGLVQTACNAVVNASIDSDCSPVVVAVAEPLAPTTALDFGFRCDSDGCAGDPGWILTADPPLVPAGTPVQVDLTTPAPNDVAFLMVSLGQGPTPSAYGDICLDFPLLASVLVRLDGAGQATLTSNIPADTNLVGQPVFLQFLSCFQARGRSNQAWFIITDGS